MNHHPLMNYKNRIDKMYYNIHSDYCRKLVENISKICYLKLFRKTKVFGHNIKNILKWKKFFIENIVQNQSINIFCYKQIKKNWKLYKIVYLNYIKC